MSTISEIQPPSWQQTVSEPKFVEKTRLWTWHGVCFLRRIMSGDSAMKVEAAAAEKGKRAPAQAFGEVLKTIPGTPDGKQPAPSSSVRPPPLPANRKVVALKGVHSAAPSVTAGNALAGKPPSAVAGGALGTLGALATVRAEHNARAAQLSDIRTEALGTQEHKVDTRLLDLIVKELTIEFSSDAERASQPVAVDKKVTSVEPASLGASGRNADPSAGAIPQKLDGTQTQASAKAQAAMAVVERIEAFVKSQRPALALTVNGAINARVEVERTGPNQVAVKVAGTRGPPPPEDVARIREAIRARGLKLSSLSVA